MPNEIDRTARHLDADVERRLFVQLFRLDQLVHVEGQVGRDLDRLDARLLDVSVQFQLVILEAEGEVDRRRLQLFDRIRAQTL